MPTLEKRKLLAKLFLSVPNVTHGRIRKKLNMPVNIEKLKTRYQQLVGKRVEFKPTEDLPEQLAKITKKVVLQDQVKRIMEEIENL
jgi:hypothetical protein